MPISEDLQILYSLNTFSPDFSRQLYRLIRNDEKEQYLTSLQGPELTKLVDFLDKALGVVPTTDDVARACLRKLQAISSCHAALPSSYIVSGEIDRVGDEPIVLGAIADVWEGTHGSNRVSIKCLRASLTNKTLKKSFFKEAIMWKRLIHPNIVPFIGVTIKPLQIVLEWMPNGTLTEFVKKNPSASRIGLLLDIANGLNYLHANRTIHGDLKGSSILVDHDGHARLTDFELASIVRGTDTVTQENVYTAVWTAPEILEGADTITRKADVYGFGMVVVEAFTGKRAFSEFTTPTVISKVMNGKRPARPQETQELGLTDSLWDMTVRCWHQDPAQRPTMTEVVELLRELLVSSLSIEADLNGLLQAYKTWDKDGQGKKAQEFADRLDEILDVADFHRRGREYLRPLQKLCGDFGVLPSSFILPPASVERDATSFASSGYSEVYGATFNGRLVVIKTLNVTSQTERVKLRRLLIKGVLVWKRLRHDNILPFVGVMFEPSILIASERMENGNIMEFIQVHQDYNRLHLLVGAVTGLKYLHEHNIVHGNLKGVNILIDSGRRARLADFGLTAILDKTTAMTTLTGGEFKGTSRWMAPELILPEEFGFIDKLEKKLPSKETDIYAIGMTILEVLTGCVPFADITRDESILFKVIEGDRPDRPPSGLSDTLWELLETTWVVQNYQQSQGRPDAGTVLDRLKEYVDHWGESIDPLVPESWRKDVLNVPEKIPQFIHVPPTTTGSDDGDTVRSNTTLEHPGGPGVSGGHALDVAEAHIPPPSLILKMRIAISRTTLAVRKWLP